MVFGETGKHGQTNCYDGEHLGVALGQGLSYEPGNETPRYRERWVPKGAKWKRVNHWWNGSAFRLRASSNFLLSAGDRNPGGQMLCCCKVILTEQRPEAELSCELRLARARIA